MRSQRRAVVEKAAQIPFAVPGRTAPPRSASAAARCCRSTGGFAGRFVFQRVRRTCQARGTAETTPARRFRRFRRRPRGSCRRSNRRCRSGARPCGPSRHARSSARRQCSHSGRGLRPETAGMKSARARLRLQQRPFEKGHLGSRMPRIPGDLDIMRHHVGQPEQIVGALRADPSAGVADATNAGRRLRRIGARPRPGCGWRAIAGQRIEQTPSNPAAGRGSRRRRRIDRWRTGPRTGSSASGRAASDSAGSPPRESACAPQCAQPLVPGLRGAEASAASTCAAHCDSGSSNSRTSVDAAGLSEQEDHVYLLPGFERDGHLQRRGRIESRSGPIVQRACVQRRRPSYRPLRPRNCVRSPE